MNKTKLGDFIERYGDGIHGTPNYDEKGTYYFINGNNLINGKIQITDETLMVTEEEYEKIKRPISNNTLLMSINGTLGRVAIYNGENIALGKSACYLNVKENKNKYFVKYVLNTKEFQKYIQLVAHGSNIKNLAPSQVVEYEFNAPDEKVQERIVLLLKTIDDKIDNNNEINAELEAMVRTIYDYWFLQFDFPDENGRPYKSSGGRMVWNEELKREIPEGWSIDSIVDLCEIVDCLHSKKPEYKYEREDCYLLSLENLSKEGYIDISKKYYISVSDYEEWTKKITVLENDFVVTNAGRAGDIGRISKGIKCAIGRNMTAIRPVSISPYYLRQFFKSNYVIEQIMNNLDCGSFFKSFNVKSIRKLKVIVPNESVMNDFLLRIESLILKIDAINEENRELTSLRDFLLPLLMNGQIGFKEC